MRQVWKFPLKVAAELIHVDVQSGTACIWALVDPEAPIVPLKFRFAGTGHPIEEENLRHVGSFLTSEGALVFHIFEILESAN